MENQVKQLKLNVKNIRSVLKRSNEKLYVIDKSKITLNKKISNNIRISERESKLETPFKGQITPKIEKSASKSANPFEMLFGAGIMLGAGVAVNAAMGLKRVFDDFKKKNQPLFDALNAGMGIIYRGITGLLDSVTGPMTKEGAFDWLARFDDDGTLSGGLLKELNDIFDQIEPLIYDVDMGLKGKNKLAKRNGVEGFEALRTGAFKKGSWTQNQRNQYNAQNPGQTPVSARGGGHTNTSYSGSTQGGTRGIKLPPAGNGTTTPVSATPTGYNPGRKGNKNTMIYLHWTAGAYGGNGSYHTVFDSDGTPKRNASYDDYSVGHTEGKNSGAVGLSISAALEATGPNNLGSQPPTQQQLNAITAEAARLAVDWGWTEADIDRNIWTHAEAGAGLDPRGLGTHEDWNGDGKPDNYGPKAWGGTGARWDFWVVRQGEQPGSGGPILRDMIKQHFRRFKNPTLNPPSNAPHSGPTGSHNPLGPQSSAINGRANAIASAGPLGVATNTKIFVVGEVT